jgi:hypothetical protein
MMDDNGIIVISNPDKPIVAMLQRGGWYTVVQIQQETNLPEIIIYMVLHQLAYMHGRVEKQALPGSVAFEYAWIDE